MTTATNPVNDFIAASQAMLAQQAAMNTAQMAHQNSVTSLTAAASTQTENARVTREIIQQSTRP
jgi:hypothetical protein